SSRAQWCDDAQASIPTRQRGSFWKKATRYRRLSLRRWSDWVVTGETSVRLGPGWLASPPCEWTVEGFQSDSSSRVSSAVIGSTLFASVRPDRAPKLRGRAHRPTRIAKGYWGRFFQTRAAILLWGACFEVGLLDLRLLRQTDSARCVKIRNSISRSSSCVC